MGIRKLTSIFLINICILFNYSCQKKGCTDPTSDNFGSEAEKDDDSCNDPRNKFAGSYNAIGDAIVNYPLAISKSSVETRVVLINSNFGLRDSGENLVPAFNLNANISKSTITIPSQLVPSVSTTFSGSGTINGNIINFQYSATTSSGNESYSVVATKL